MFSIVRRPATRGYIAAAPLLTCRGTPARVALAAQDMGRSGGLSAGTASWPVGSVARWAALEAPPAEGLRAKRRPQGANRPAVAPQSQQHSPQPCAAPSSSPTSEVEQEPPNESEGQEDLRGLPRAQD